MAKPRIFRPQGWGIGVNLIDEYGQKAEAERVRKRISDVIADLKPDWFHTWMPSWGAPYPGHIPCTEEGLDADLYPARYNTLLILNEPERGWSPGVADPADAAKRTRVTLEKLWRQDFEFHWTAPNGNINDANMTWLKQYAHQLTRIGIVAPSYWGVHLYSPHVDWAQTHLDRFWEWWGEFGCERPVVFTECGAGSNASIDEHLAMMTFFRQVLDDDRVLGAAYFAAYSYVDGGRNYLGVMDTPELKARWLELRGE